MNWKKEVKIRWKNITDDLLIKRWLKTKIYWQKKVTGEIKIKKLYPVKYLRFKEIFALIRENNYNEDITW